LLRVVADHAAAMQLAISSQWLRFRNPRSSNPSGAVPPLPR
jgi:hypothetical protein